MSLKPVIERFPNKPLIAYTADLIRQVKQNKIKHMAEVRAIKKDIRKKEKQDADEQAYQLYLKQINQGAADVPVATREDRDTIQAIHYVYDDDPVLENVYGGTMGGVAPLSGYPEPNTEEEIVASV